MTSLVGRCITSKRDSDVSSYLENPHDLPRLADDHSAVATTEQEAAAFVEWIQNHVCTDNLYESPRYSKVSTVEEYQKLYETNGN